MLEEKARVVSVEGDDAWVETRRTTACSSCAVNKGCGAGVLGKLMGDKPARLRVANTIRAAVGDVVVIGVEESALTRGSFAAYVLPLLCMIGVVAIGGMLLESFGMKASDATDIFFGAIGLLSGFLWLSRYNARLRLDARYQPVILRNSDDDALSMDECGGK